MGASIELPRLIPSFTSKGFLLKKKTGGDHEAEESEIKEVVDSVGPFLNDSFLISAYDIHYQHFGDPSELFRVPEVVLLDSGGYELAIDYDPTVAVRNVYKPKRGFKERQYRKILRTIDPTLPMIIASFDWGYRKLETKAQMEEAQNFFADFRQFSCSLLIKPGGNRRYLDVDEIAGQVTRLRYFDVVGVTERELANDLLDKLKAVAKLRAAMDRKGVTAPIHIWGGLDPTLTPLYFFAGAEIFDGVSWLRYAYHDGIAIYRDSVALLSAFGINCTTNYLRSRILMDNVNGLKALQIALRQFADSGCTDFDVFGTKAESYKRAYNILQTELKGEV